MKTKHFIHRLSAGVAVGLIVSLAALGLAETASAQTGNGLKDIKGKADAFGGAGDDDGMGDTAGSLALSFARRWYVQGDGLIGIGRGDTNWALGGHIFWYDPKIGILDFNVSFLDFKVRHVTRAGVHGQYFWGKSPFAEMSAIRSSAASRATRYLAAHRWRSIKSPVQSLRLARTGTASKEFSGPMAKCCCR